MQGFSAGLQHHCLGRAGRELGDEGSPRPLLRLTGNGGKDWVCCVFADAGKHPQLGWGNDVESGLSRGCPECRKGGCLLNRDLALLHLLLDVGTKEPGEGRGSIPESPGKGCWDGCRGRQGGSTGTKEAGDHVASRLPANGPEITHQVPEAADLLELADARLELASSLLPHSSGVVEDPLARLWCPKTERSLGRCCGYVGTGTTKPSFKGAHRPLRLRGLLRYLRANLGVNTGLLRLARGVTRDLEHSSVLEIVPHRPQPQ